MKKISNMQFGSLLIILMVIMNSEINKIILLNNTGVNSWITLIITYIIGFIPLSIFIFIGNSCGNKTLSERNKELFKGLGIVVNGIIFIIFLILGITLLYNISQFIGSQFLYRTPLYIIAASLMGIVLYNTSKGIATITRVGLILLVLNIFLLLISTTSLIEFFEVDNLKPFLKDGIEKIPGTAIITCTNIILPFLLLLVIPKNKLDHPDKYVKTVIISYIIGACLSVLVVVMTLGVLGIHLEKIYEYPQYIFLKKVKFFGFLERVENIVASQWIIGNFMYLSIIIYYLGDMITNEKKKRNFIMYGIGGFILIVSLMIFKNNTSFDNYILKYFSYIILGLEVVYLLTLGKLGLDKFKNKNCKQE